jgi:hypothetical protein
VADLGDLRIPAAMRPTAEQVIKLTDQVCTSLLDEEYAGLARQVIGKLARKRPLQSGPAATPGTMRPPSATPRETAGQRR